MKLPQKIKWIFVIIILLAIVITLLLVVLRKDQSPVPKNVKHKLSFTVLENQPKTLWKIPPNSATYNGGSGVLTMTARSATATMIIAEQAQPDSFSDVPQLYPTLLNKLNQYEDLQTAIGTVTLTHPKELNGGQTAVANLRQTLIFVRPSKNLTDDQWKDFFASMQWE